jgi:DNA-binding helix-hairpin-helix protein with protein kinase domain
MNRLFDSAGREVRLGGRIGKGGEGTVFDVADDPSCVAKVYHEVVPPNKAAKLGAMVQQANPSLLQISAWPTMTLHGARGGRTVGILMPKLGGYRPIHQLYSPAQRKVTFPAADWSFLLHAARNVAQAIKTIHAQGVVVGDINQGNIVVSSNALVKFIDCDSFQIESNGKTFLCEVGVGHFTPPELQGRSFGSVVRTPNHDNFGLAAVCFHLLFMGRHPFVGKYLGSADMPIEKAIREFRFAFGSGAGGRQMTPPPHVLRLAGVSQTAAILFERAFGVDAVRNGTRPSAAEWVIALDQLRHELRACSRYAGHKYYKALGECPWCAIGEAGGPDFFISINAVRIGSGFDVRALWTAISRVPIPGVSSEAPTVTAGARVKGRPLPGQLQWVKWLRPAAGWGAMASVAGCLFGILPPAGWFLVIVLILAWVGLRGNKAYGEEKARRVAVVKAVEEALNIIKGRWGREVGEPVSRFQAMRSMLDRNRNEYLSLESEYRRDRGDLNTKREENQRRRFLEQYLIQRAGIRQVGPGLKATLASYGIETAADVIYQTVSAVPGFGPARTRELLGWRSKLEQGFRFDATKGVDSADIAALDQRYALKRQDLERVLRTGPEEMRKLGSLVSSRSSALLPELERLSLDLAQAKADADAA